MPKNSEGPRKKRDGADLSDGSRTLGEVAFREIRRRVLDGTFEAGMPLRLERLRLEFSVGFTPLREALMRLSSEGLVDMEGQRGFRVASVSIADLEDVMFSRAEIEAIALKEAIERGDDEWEAAIVGAYHRMSRRPQIDPATGLIAEGWAEAHLQFHRSLIDACSSRWVKRFWQTLFDQAQRYRHIAIVHGGRARDDSEEHYQLMNAVLSRTASTALAASRAHIESTTRVARAFLQQDTVSSQQRDGRGTTRVPE